MRPLARDGVRLVPLTRTDDERVGDRSDRRLVVPPGATVLGAMDDQLLIGTRDLGTARYRDGDAHPHDWLRRKQMFEDATGLSVACARAQDCWLATGARQAWHWNGERFTAGGPDVVVLAVARDPAGPIYALHRAPQEKELHLSRIEGTAWTLLPKVSLTTPGDAPEVSFARFASIGHAVGRVAVSRWRGAPRVRHRDRRAGERQGRVSPHRGAMHRTTEAKDKMLPIPVGVVDADVRGDTAWFATNEGIARLVGRRRSRSGPKRMACAASSRVR